MANQANANNKSEDNNDYLPLELPLNEMELEQLLGESTVE